jgi:regulator of protease activity HflC (stomatin/prohibitin superfamily)
MGWIVSIIIVGVITAVALVAGIMFRQREGTTEFFEDSPIENNKIGTILIVGALVLFGVWGGLHTILASVKQVDAGHVGIVYTFKNITGQTGEGLQWIAPWQGLRVESIQVQKYSTADLPIDQLSGIAVPAGHAATASKETQDVFIKASLIFRVSPDTIQALLRNVGANWRDRIVAPNLLNFLKEETARYNSVDVIPSREMIRLAIKDRLKNELAKYSIDVQDFLIDNISFRSEFMVAIENKQIAKQQALEQEAKVEMQHQIGLQAQAKAEGDAAAIKITADANAYANTVLAESLKNQDEVIAYTLVKNLAPGIKVMILPSGQNFLLDLKSLGIDLSGE